MVSCSKIRKTITKRVSNKNETFSAIVVLNDSD